MTILRTLLITASLVVTASLVRGQFLLEDVIVETYYISDAADAQTEVGGTLEEGSVTYRVYVQLSEDVRLRALFGTANHTFRVSSTAPIFNNTDRGELWGHEIPDNRLDENTVALDSWLSFGGATDEHWGILKTEDVDGSIIGGAEHEDGLLISELAGIPLTEADGLFSTEDSGPVNLFVTGDDPAAVFGEETAANSFESNNFRAQIQSWELEEVNNRILIAQFTTAGELEFELNIEVVAPNGDIVRFVSSDDVLGENEIFTSLLTYPPVCGCTDPYFLEYDPAAGCDDGSCVTPIVFGCNDPAACNFDPEVNFNVPELCCILPDNCDGLDPDLICDGAVNTGDIDFGVQVSVYPNPARDQLNIELPTPSGETIFVELHNSAGTLVRRLNFVPQSAQTTLLIPLHDLTEGLYFINLQYSGNNFGTKVLRTR
jgi:hypothetical protein